MITIKCTSKDTAKLSDMVPFQGDLKKRTDKDLTALGMSVKDDGLLMPFALWNDDGVYRILDGHARYAALIKLALSDVSILTQEWPVILIDAADEDNARKALLQISSQYGRVDKKGLVEFTAPISDYKAPIITKAYGKVKHTTTASAYRIIRLKVAADSAEQIITIMKNTPGVQVL